ncbi:MAG: hypothetical protein WBM87_00900 [Woeseiaceae bacterium]
MALPLLSACPEVEREEGPKPVVIGKLEDADIREASGLARSYRQDNVLWTINDNGADEWVHAISPRGARLGEFVLKKSKNVDWEDLASFTLDDEPYLLIADIGDNEAKYKSRTLYVVSEPPAKKKDQEKVDWQVDFRYPDGPRDAESAAVDIDNQRVLVLSKRDIPPVLYELPLRPDGNKTLTARRLGTITSLPRPSRQDVEFAPKLNDWYWQPVGMDISDDNLAAVILTYRAVYYYTRLPGQDWLVALNAKPQRVSIGNLRNAEAIAFGDRRRTVIVTGESRHSPVLAIDFNEDSTE